MHERKERAASRPPGRLGKKRAKRVNEKAMEAVERRRLLAAHVAGDSTVYTTIQSAVDAAPTGGTVTVDPGTYNELVTVDTDGLTILGANAGVDARTLSRANSAGAGESVVRGSDLGGGTRSSAFFVSASNVTIDGFTVQDSSANGQFGGGIVLGPNIHGSHVLDNVVQNNLVGLILSNDSASAPAVIAHNLFRSNNLPGNNTGRAIYTDGGFTGGTLTTVVIDDNTFFDNHGGLPAHSLEAAVGFEAGPASSQSHIAVTNNVFDFNGKAMLVTNASNLIITGNVVARTRDTRSGALRFEGGVHDVLIGANTIYNSPARAIRIDNVGSPGANFNFTITGNNIFRNGLNTALGVNHDGLFVGAGQFQGQLNATNNWWGDPSGPSGDGPGTGDAVFANGNDVAFIPWATAPFASSGQLPFFGKALSSDSRIDAVNFDLGGEGVAYHDLEASNRGGAANRSGEGVDLEKNSDPGSAGVDVAFTRAGEWLEYTVDVAQAGTYNVDFRVASPQAVGGKFHLEVDGTNVSGTITIPNTGGWQNWKTITDTGIQLTAGKHVLRLNFDTNGSTGAIANFNWFKLTRTGGVPTPGPNAPTALAASAVSSSRIDLTWADNSDNETGFKLERSTDGINFTQIATPAANATSFSDTNLSANTKYFYRIRATNAGGDSDFSKIANATTNPAPTGDQNVTYISTGDTWKYLDNGSDEGAAWRAAGFDDSSWKSGQAQLGYGDGDEQTVVNFGPDPQHKFITTYFRKTFSVADASKVKSLTLHLLRDDGAVIYINGQEVLRDNMDPGTVSFDTLASAAIEDSSFHTFSISPSRLISGTNTIAVEIHQGDAFSSDISFDMDLKAVVSGGVVQPPPDNGGQLPSPWTSGTIGSNSPVGDASFDDGTFSVAGDGSDIWGKSDNFRFVYQQLDGDGEIVAHVAGMDRKNLFAKAGIMIRDTLAADAKQASIFVTPANGLRFIRRKQDAAPSTSTVSGNYKDVAAPQWLRLVRSGDTITAYRSSDGQAWTLIGSDAISMGQQVFVGLAVTSHQSGLVNAATFDNVTVA